jgi:membrane-bound lytic murein transglycosylase D
LIFLLSTFHTLEHSKYREFMNQSFSYLMVLLLLISSTSLPAQDTKSYTLEALEAKKRKETGDHSIPETTDAQFKERIEKISNQFPMRFNNLVKSHIKAYTEHRRAASASIIGRSAIYFPIFETSLMRNHVPTDLKYLSIVESALNPKATSPAGAQGLWQFMKGTGEQYNLRITKYVDERSDPHMSSDAAAKYLKDLYAIYGDWALSIAAYNCGPGRINSAIEKAGTSDYWSIIKYLPHETRNYVPAFIAVAYMMNYYHLHNIYPEFPDYNLQVTESLRVFKKLTFAEIAQISDTELGTVKFLNPSYKLDFIPESKIGHILTLPMAKMTAYRQSDPTARTLYFDPIDDEPTATEAKPYLVSNLIEDKPIKVEKAVAAVPAKAKKKVEYKNVKKIHSVKKGENLGNIADQYGVGVSEIRKWNKLNSSLLSVNQKLVVYQTERVVIEEEIEEEENVEQNREVAYFVDGKPVYTQRVMANPIEAEETPVRVAAPNKKTPAKKVVAEEKTKTDVVTTPIVPSEDNQVVEYYVDGKPVYAQRVMANPIENKETTITVATPKKKTTPKQVASKEKVKTDVVEETTATVEAKDDRVVDYYVDGKPVYSQRVVANPIEAEETPVTVTAPKKKTPTKKVVAEEKTKTDIVEKTTATVEAEEDRVVEYYVDGKPVYAQRIQANPTDTKENVATKSVAPQKKSTTSATEKNEISYDVRRGDTLWKIATKYSDVSVQDLMKWNNITSHSQLKPGMELKIFTKDK